MLPKVLYSALIGALSALFFGIIFGIPKLIRFIAKEVNKHKVKRELRTLNQTTKEPQMKHLNKRTVIIASCVILAIAAIASTVTLMLTDENEYIVIYYNNEGVCFSRDTKGEERMYTRDKDNTIYKVEKCSGKYPSEPTPPTNVGYIFLGWYQNPECTDKFLFGKDKINSDINL